MIVAREIYNVCECIQCHGYQYCVQIVSLLQHRLSLKHCQNLLLFDFTIRIA